MRFRTRLSIVAVTGIAFAASSARSLSQTALPTGRIDVRILNAIHEPEESAVSYVTVEVTIRSSGEAFVIPNCAEAAEKRVFCMSSLQRANGKTVGVRKGLAATLGFEAQEYWKALTVPANSETDFQFSIDMGLLNVRPGEPVRIAFWIWPNAESMKDFKRGTEILTPVFRIPLKPVSD
jgi:hypothetical protein